MLNLNEPIPAAKCANCGKTKLEHYGLGVCYQTDGSPYFEPIPAVDYEMLDKLWHIAVVAQTNGGEGYEQRHANLHEWRAACDAYEQASGLEICRSEDMVLETPPHRKLPQPTAAPSSGGEGWTKGPYHVDPKRRLRVADSSDTTIASCGTSGSIRDDWEANAALIAAAPELYDALQEAYECVRKMLLGHKEPSELNPEGWHNALAKARGVK